MAHFYALAEDLQPVIAAVEGKRPLVYTLMAHYEQPDIPSFHSGLALPTMGAPSPEPSAVACPAYLVTPKGQPVAARKVDLRAGGSRWIVDQLDNDDSTVLWHGGIYGNKVLLHGRVATVSKSPTAQSLQRAFDSQIRRRFKRIQAFWVGPHAEQLLNDGFRLAAALQSPPEYDLQREAASDA